MSRDIMCLLAKGDPSAVTKTHYFVEDPRHFLTPLILDMYRHDLKEEKVRTK